MFSIRKNFNSSENFLWHDKDKCKTKKKAIAIYQCRTTTAKASAKSGRDRVFTNVPFCPRDAKLRNVRCGLVLLLRRAENTYIRSGRKVSSFV